MTKRRVALAAGMALLLAQPAFADSLSESVQDLLDDVQRQVDDARVWKLHVRPTFSQSVIYTDNVFLNDRAEQPFRLIGIAGPGGFTADPGILARRQSRLRDFQNVESEGRIDDLIVKSSLGLGFSLPLNPTKTKLFQRKSIEVLSVTATNSEYMDRNELDNTNFALESEILGLFSDLLDFSWGDRLSFRLHDTYSKIEEPLDTPIVDLQQNAILSTQFDDFGRTENLLEAEVGYDYGRLDAKLGGDWKLLRLDDRELRQAEYDRYGGGIEVGYDLPWIQNKRAFIAGDFDKFSPEDRAGDAGDLQALNSGDRKRAVVGVEGELFSKKISGRIEAGYLSWAPDDDGTSADRNHFNAPAGLVELAWKPWSDQKTQFQLSYERAADASAIANFNATHKGTISMSTEVVPRSVDLDVSFGFTRTDPSEGPNSRLYDFGVGVTYHAFEQADFNVRYAFRYADSSNELFIESSFQRNGRQYSFISHSDGDFYANVLELGFDLRF